MSAKRTKKMSEKQPKRGRANLRRLHEMNEEEVMESSPAELADLPDDFWDDADVVTPEPKEAISLRVDRDVLAWFRDGGPRYQTRMNAVLRSYMKSVQRKTVRPRSRKSRNDSSNRGAS